MKTVKVYGNSDDTQGRDIQINDYNPNDNPYSVENLSKYAISDGKLIYRPSFMGRPTQTELRRIRQYLMSMENNDTRSRRIEDQNKRIANLNIIRKGQADRQKEIEEEERRKQKERNNPFTSGFWEDFASGIPQGFKNTSLVGELLQSSGIPLLSEVGALTKKIGVAGSQLTGGSLTIQRVNVHKDLPFELAMTHARNILKTKKQFNPKIVRNFWHFKNKPKTHFIKGTFRTKKINPNISITFGVLKNR